MKKNLTTTDYNKFTTGTLDTKIKEKELLNKYNICNIVKSPDLNTKLVTLAIKTELKADQYNIVKRKALDSNYFCSKSHFENDGTQNYLVFQPVFRYA